MLQTTGAAALTNQTLVVSYVVDARLEADPLAGELMRDAGRFTSKRLEVPVQVEAPYSPAWRQPLDTPTPNIYSGVTKMLMDPRMIDVPVAMSVFDMAVNRVDNAKNVSVEAASIDIATGQLIDVIGRSVYGTGSDGVSFTGLGAAIDDGTDVANYGGISRTTFAGWRSFRVAAAGGTITADQIDNADIQAGLAASTDGPNLIATSSAGFTFIKKALAPRVTNFYSQSTRGGETQTLAAQNQATQGNVLSAGTPFLNYNGKPVIYSRIAPSGVMHFINTRSMKFYGLQLAGSYKGIVYSAMSVPAKGSSFDSPTLDSQNTIPGLFMSETQQPFMQNAVAFKIGLAGEFANTKPRTCAKITSITAG